MQVLTDIQAIAIMEFNIHPVNRGFIVAGHIGGFSRAGECLDTNGFVQYDSNRRDCFFSTEEKAQKAIEAFHLNYCTTKTADYL